MKEKDYKEFIEYLPYKLFIMNQDLFSCIEDAKSFILVNNLETKIKETIPERVLSGIVKFGAGFVTIKDDKFILNNYIIDLF